MDTFKPGWYLLYTKPKHEKKAVDYLNDLNIEAFLPLVPIFRKWSDRVKLVNIPLFPSYVFIYLKQMSDYFVGLSYNGILYYVKFEGKIARVDDTIVQDLRIAVSNGNNIEVSASTLSCGERLVVSDGPFAGMCCEVVRFNNKRKIIVRLNLIQRNVLVEMPICCFANL